MVVGVWLGDCDDVNVGVTLEVDDWLAELVGLVDCEGLCVAERVTEIDWLGVADSLGLWVVLGERDWLDEGCWLVLGVEVCEGLPESDGEWL